MTGPTGGLLAMARCAGGAVTIGGAGLTAGTIFRGSGRAGAAGGGAAATTGGADLTAEAWGTTGGAGRRCGLWASASSSCFLASMAFMTSPGFETCERSILGAIA